MKPNELMRYQIGAMACGAGLPAQDNDEYYLKGYGHAYEAGEKETTRQRKAHDERVEQYNENK